MPDNRPAIKTLMTNAAVTHDIDHAVDHIQYIGFLIERHVQSRYNEEEDYRILLTDKYASVFLTEWDVEMLTHFLFYVLLNFPDRAWVAAKALGRCYNTENQEALCNGIELYRWKDEDVATNLIKAITDENDNINKLSMRILNLFRDLVINGPDSTRSFLYQRFEHDLDNYIFK